jgi:molybdopterin-guanine dinucleotide biosynthesis protein B
VRPGATAAPPLLAFSGPSGAGKTTLLVKLIPALTRRGLAVAAVKHAGHAHALDVPAKDSARLRRAGAIAVAVQGPSEMAYFGPPVKGLRELAALLPAADLTLVEGFKGAPVPRVEVHRSQVDGRFLCSRDRRVIAVVSDVAPPRPLPWFTPSEVGALADFVVCFTRGALAAGRSGAQHGARGARERARERGRSQERAMATPNKAIRGKKTGRAVRATGEEAAEGGATVRQAGRKGGRATLARRGPEFYSRIGRKGGKSSGNARKAGAAGGKRSPGRRKSGA